MREFNRKRTILLFILCALFSSNSLLFAVIGPVTGCVEWSHDMPAGVYAAHAVGPLGTIYVPCEDGNLYVFDANGTARGYYSSPGGVTISAPAVASDGTVYFGNADGIFRSLAQDGQINWDKTLDGAIAAAPVLADDSTVYVTTLGGTVYAHSPEGTLQWEYSIPHLDQTIESITASAAIGVDGSVYVAAMYSPKIYALDPNSGAERWISDLTDELDPDASDAGRDYHGFIVTPAVGTNGTIYTISTYSKTLFALDPVDGHVLWQTELNKSQKDTGLVGYWKLDAYEYTINGPVIYDSQGNYHGTPYEMRRLNVTDGHIGNSISFNGIDEYIQITGYKGITGTASRTCSTWIKTSQTGGVILSWGNDNYGGKWIVRVNGDGRLRAEVQGGYMIGSTVISDNQWHHIAVVVEDDGTPDITEAQLYVDGNPETVGATADEPINTASEQDVVIGSFIYTEEYIYFEGLIDEVRIYDRALAPEEIKPFVMPEDYLITRYGDAACWTSPVVGPDGTVYVSFDHPYLFAVNPDGTVKWCKRIGMTGGFSMAVDSANKIYAASDDGTLYVIDSDGILLSQYNSNDGILNPIVIQNGTVLVVGQSGNIRLISGDSCSEAYDLTWLADLTNDGRVNLSDFAQVSQFWLQGNDFFIQPENTFRLDRIDYTQLTSDIDRDFYVNLMDFMFLCEQWLLNAAL